MAGDLLQSRLCEFWLGRAGSGKTHGCLAAIADELKRSPRGQPLVFLVPEQATAQMERRLAGWPGLPGGYTRARVFSFHHLAREVTRWAGGAGAARIGDAGRLMLIRQALTSRREALQVFGAAADQRGVTETLSDSILEFQRYGWTPADLEQWVAARPPEQQKTDLLARKLSDLALLWHEYEAGLTEAGLEDPALFYKTAAGAVRHWEGLEAARVWVDGFASFTTLEWELLAALLERCSAAVIALCLEPKLIIDQVRERTDAGPNDESRWVSPGRLFDNIKQTRDFLAERLGERGWRIEDRALPFPDAPTRFARSRALRHLESAILGQPRPKHCGDDLWEADVQDLARVASSLPGSPSVPITIIKATDRRAEVEAIARRIVTLCRTEADGDHPTSPLTTPMTWRDVAVIARDLDPYAPVIREVFDQFEIPYFLDSPRRIEGHPLTRLLRTAIDIYRSNFDGLAVMAHVKTGLTPLREVLATSQLENHIIKFGPQKWKTALSAESRARDASEAERRNQLWNTLSDPLVELWKELTGERKPSRVLWKYLERIGAPATLDRWIEQARAEGDEETAQLHEQAWVTVIDWLEDLDAVYTHQPPSETGETDRDAYARIHEDLSAFIQSGLASTRARLIPPTLNQVIVGSVERSRTPEVRHVFVIGMNEKEFPRTWTPAAVLGDEERDRLTADGRGIGPCSREKHRHEHFLAYIALTRAGEGITLTHPLRDDDGKAGEPSPYLKLVLKSFPKAKVQEVQRSGWGEPAGLPLRPEEWLLRLSAACADLSSPDQRTELLKLMAAGHPLDHPGLSAAQRHSLGLAAKSLAMSQAPRVEPTLARAFWSAAPRLRVTALEQYGVCPFKFFAGEMLGLTERETERLKPMDLGALRHSILEALFNALRGPTGLDWGHVDLLEADRLIDEHLDKTFRRPEMEVSLRTTMLDELTVHELARQLKLFARALARVARRSCFHQTQAEWRFDADDALRIDAGGLRFSIVGSIDRIDTAATGAAEEVRIVYDYKSSQHQIDLGRMLAGADLQLLTYGLALGRASASEQAGRVRVGGFFYWSLASPMRDVQGGEAEEEPLIDAAWFEGQAPAGLFVENVARLLDAEVAAGEKSLAYPFTLNKDGSFRKKPDAHWPDGSIDRLLQHQHELLTRMIEEVLAGKIPLSPIGDNKESACDRCAYTSVCRRAEPGNLHPRTLRGIGRDEALSLLEKADERGEET